MNGLRSRLPWIGSTRGIIDGKHIRAMGKARGLFDFLVDKQTSPDGLVYYGRPLGYAWIRAQMANAPPVRTLQRWMARLREEGYIEIRRIAWGGGMIVRVLRQKKWANQLALPFAADCGKRVEDREEKLWKSAISMPPQVAASYRHKWRFKEVEEQDNEKTNPRAPTPRANPPLWKLDAKAKRILGEIEVIRATIVGGRDDEPGVIRARERIREKYAELDRIGQFEKAG